jgi:hypothetical protein
MKVHGNLVVLSSLAHLFLREADLMRLERTSSGAWRVVPWVSLPGSVFAVASDRHGNLVLAVEPPPEMLYGVGIRGAECDLEVVRVTSDGQLVSFE